MMNPEQEKLQSLRDQLLDIKRQMFYLEEFEEAINLEIDKLVSNDL